MVQHSKYVFPNKLDCDRRIILNSCRFYLFQSERLRLCPLPPVWNVWSKIVIDCYRSPAHPVCRRQSAAQQGVPWVTRGGGSPLSDVLCHYHHLLQLWRLFIWRGDFEISNFNNPINVHCWLWLISYQFVWFNWDLFPSLYEKLRTVERLWLRQCVGTRPPICK